MHRTTCSLIILVCLLACDQSPVDTVGDPVGTWQIADPESISFAEKGPMQIWELYEDGFFSGFTAGAEECFIANGKWETKRNNIWITLYPDKEYSIAFAGTFKINNGDMTIVGVEDKQKTVWKRSDKAPQVLLFEQGYCRDDQDE